MTESRNGETTLHTERGQTARSRQDPAVSIIMPVYNSEKYLRDCLESILAQSFDAYELLLVDDGSTDASAAICDEYAQKNRHIRVFHKENGGICEARNYGLDRAAGEYVAFSDHDDIVLPGFLEENYRAAVENRADLVKFGRKEFLFRGDTLLKTDKRFFEDRVIQGSEIAEVFLPMRLKGGIDCVWDGFFRRAFLEENDLRFNPVYKKGGEDIDFCSRCFALVKTAVFRSQIYYEHYIRIGVSTSTAEDPDRMRKYEFLADNLTSCVKELDIDLQKQRAQYMTCITKEMVYPSVKYLLKAGKTWREIAQMLEKIYRKRNIKPVPAVELHRVSGKWWIFTSLFLRKRFWLAIASVRFYNLIK